MEDEHPYNRPEWFRPVLFALQSSDSRLRKAAQDRLWFESGILGPLRTFITARMRDEQAAWDVLADVIADLPTALRKSDLSLAFTTPGSLWAFMLDMAVKRSRRHHAKRWRRERTHIYYSPLDPSPVSFAPLEAQKDASDRAQDLLNAAASTLSEAEMQLIVEAKVKGSTADELAERYGCSTVAMQKRIQRAHAKLLRVRCINTEASDEQADD